LPQRFESVDRVQQAWTNVLQLIQRKLRERQGGLRQILLCSLNRGRNCIENGNDLLRPLGGKRRQRKQEMVIRAQALVHIEVGIELPATNDVKFLSDPCHGRPNQPVIDLA